MKLLVRVTAPPGDTFTAEAVDAQIGKVTYVHAPDGTPCRATITAVDIVADGDAADFTLIVLE